MRVTTNMISSIILENIEKNMTRMLKCQEEISTAKRINRPSDNAADTSKILMLKSNISSIEQFIKNIDDGNNILMVTEFAIDSIIDNLQRVKEIAQRASDDSQGIEGRKSVAPAVNQILEELVEISKFRHNGKYIFGGIETTTPPYSVTLDSDGNITSVIPNPDGINGEIKREISDNVFIKVNTSGNDIFSTPSGLGYTFDILINLRDALIANNVDSIRQAFTDIDAAIDRVLFENTVAGSRILRLNMSKERLENDSLKLTELLSETQDTDMAKLAVEFNKEEAVYKAALSSSTRILQPALLDFLR